MHSSEDQSQPVDLQGDGVHRVIAIAGSLRRESLNRQLLRAAADQAPSSMLIRVYSDLGSIPLFDEDLEADNGPDGVARLRDAVVDSAGMLIATPEYNQSMPGVVKNMIDWLSRGEPGVLSGKPVGLLGATVGPWGTRLAQSALRHTLTACGAAVMPTPQLYLRDAGDQFGDGRVADQRMRAKLDEYLAAFSGWVKAANMPR